MLCSALLLSTTVQLYGPESTAEIIGAIRRSQPGFVPGGGAARLHYRLVYRTLGFRLVDRLAEWKRPLLPNIVKVSTNDTL